MTEGERPEGQSFEIIGSIKPVEKIVHGDGSVAYVMEVTGNEMAHDAAKKLFGQSGKVTELGQRRGSDRSSFGFSGIWNAPWNPEGPKKNWGPPSDPSLN